MPGSQEVTAGERAEGLRVQVLVSLFDKHCESVTHQRLKVWPLLPAGAGAAAGSWCWF